MISLSMVIGFVHKDSLYKDRPRRGCNRPRVKFDHRSSSNHYSDIDRNLGGIKMKILAFQGKVDPEAYLEWEREVEMIFYIRRYSEKKKIKLVIMEFTDYAMVWWDKLVKDKRRNGEKPVRIWDELKAIMRKKDMFPSISIGNYLIKCRLLLRVIRVLRSIKRI